MKNYKIAVALLCVVFVSFAFSCSHVGIRLDTPEKKYLGARSELNLLLEQYIDMQDSVSDKDHETAKTAFWAADRALDTWAEHLGDADYDYTKDMKVWLDAKNVVMKIIRSLVEK